MKYGYKTKYNSPEHKKAKAAGAKWDSNLKLWMSDVPIDGLIAEQPSNKYLIHFSYNDQDKVVLIERFKDLCIQAKRNPEIIGKIPEIESKIREKFQEDTFVNQCCIIAIDEAKKLLGRNVK